KLPGVETRISEDGEILVKSPANMLGYFKDEEKTRETFTEDGFLKTGDRGEIDEEGRLKITGRLKEMFKTSKGKYIAPAPIENRLMAQSEIEMVCVSGENYTRPHALVMLSEDARESAREESARREIEDSLKALLDTVNTGLDPHERLQFITVVREEWSMENNFLTPTMKLKRNVVEDTYRKDTDAWYEKAERIIWQ
ncbi:MAG: AMP-binding protein, partial [Oleiphilaceae bacterium]|nr:AMP-binding protein [Oleiphilaceae bacterium]